MKKYVNNSEIEATTRVLVCGSRNADISFSAVDSYISEVLESCLDDNIEFVSGSARGGDKLGEEYAKNYGYKLTQFNPDWIKYGKAAGPIRNTQMIDYIEESDNPVVIAFWDGKSAGTRNTIKTAQSRHIPVHIIRYAESKPAQVTDTVESGISLDDSNNLSYDWREDEPEDILPLAEQKISKSTKNGHLFFYSFKANKSHEDWKKFLDILKHGTTKESLSNLTDYLSGQLFANFNKFDMILYPKSSSIINETLVESIHKIDPYIPAYSISKADVKNITFDWKSFNEKFSGDSESYEKNKKSIERAMDRIHKSDKFSMQHQMYPRYRKFVKDFLELSDLDDALEDIINSTSILVLDDIVTTGSTIIEIINMLNGIGFEGDIVIYSLINNR